MNRKLPTGRLPFIRMQKLAAVILLAAWVLPARAVDVRIATMNVCNLSKGGDATLGAFSNIVKRVQPDVLALQEVSSSQEATLTALFATMPKPLPYRAFMQNPGTGRTTASGDKVAIFSAWPITDAAIVKENYHDPDAVEFMRWPIHAKIEVPGALNPLHVVTLHSVATTVSIPLRIHRGLEARRVREYVEEQILGADENDVEYVVLGDFNDSAPGRWDAQGEGATFQPESFTYAQFRKYETNGTFGSGANFVLGRDHPWYVTNESRASVTMDYRPYPTERCGDVRPVDAFQTGTASNWVTEWGSVYRLDYILFSPEIMASSYGAPVAEVYHSANDSAASPGLRKPGPLPDAASSTNASDHLLVFSDFHMIDEISGLTPVAILSEVVHNPTNASANYVEVCNTGNGTLDLTGYTLELYPDGSSIAAETRSLDGITLAAGTAYWLACDSNSARRAWGAAPDATWIGIGYADGNDAIVLRNAAGAVHDIYGAIGVDGSGKPWEYAGSAASRIPGVTEPMSTWHAAEWDIADATSATPGTHLAVSEGNAAITDVSLLSADGDSTAPLATNDFRFAATAIPNVLASNLAMTAYFRVDGGELLSVAMTNASGNAWLSAATNGAQSAGSSIDYYVALAFDGPGGWSPVSSAVRGYTFPGNAAATNLTDVLFNEIKTSGATNEFIELVGAAGTDLSGWMLESRDKSASLKWRCTFLPGCSIPDDNVTDEFGNRLGFFVAGSSATKNRDFAITNSPESTSGGLIPDTATRVLVLKNASGTVMDAVALAATNEFVQMDLPKGLSTDVARGAANYLHCLGAAPTGAAASLQCPNNVRTGCTDSGKYALPDWCTTNATPGALNKHQTNALLRLARVDRDADGLLDDEDNCPDTPNTIQSDIDDDGYGDDCDDDMDGDAIPNAIDNCPTEYNPRQEDFDADGIGNACDGDFDADEWEGRVETFFVDFEGDTTKASFTTVVTNTWGGRTWILGDGTMIGSLATDRKIGDKAMRIRTNGTLTLIGTLTNGLHGLSFIHAPFSSNTRVTNIFVEASTDGGKTWDTYARITTTNTSMTSFVTAGLEIPAGAAFRLRAGTGSSSARLDIDNILLVSKLAVEVACELAAEVSAEYNGAVHTNEFYVTPSNAVWSVRYTADSGTTFTTAPTEVGVYTAIVTVQAGAAWDAATFEFPASLTIAEVQLDPSIETDETIATAVTAILSANVAANTTNDLSLIFEYGTSTAYGNKILTGTVSGFATNYIDCTIENLRPDTLYYWRLHVGSAVSPPRSFTTDSLERPVTALDGVDASQALFSWSTVEGATNYLLNVYSIAGAGSVSDITIDFRDWTYSPDSSSVKTQETAIGTWSFSGVSIYDIGSSNGIGSQGYASFAKSSAWLQFPPMGGVSAISVAARGPYGSASLKLQASNDGGTTFAEIETFQLSTTVMSNRHVWAAGQPEGTVFRLSRIGRNTVNVHDIVITVSSAAEVALAGMPANVAAPIYLLEDLSPSTTYYATVKAQGHGWETDWSEPLEITTDSGSGSIPTVTLPDGIPELIVGVVGTVPFNVSGNPQPTVTVKNSSVTGPYSFSTNAWDASAMSGTYVLSYRPDAADPAYATNFVVTASNVFGTCSANLSIRVVTAEEAFAQWLEERFGIPSTDGDFAEGEDADGDGMTTWEEFLADTCPTDASSCLKLELKSLPTSAQAVFRFTPSTSRWYQLVWWTNLLSSNTVLNLGRPPSTNEILIETNMPPEWFGAIRALLDEPEGEGGAALEEGE